MHCSSCCAEDITSRVQTSSSIWSHQVPIDIEFIELYDTHKLKSDTLKALSLKCPCNVSNVVTYLWIGHSVIESEW